MEVPDNLLCLFNAELEEKDDGSYIIEVPAQEVSKGQIQSREMYRAAVIQTETVESENRSGDRDGDELGPPVEEGERRIVDIEDVGEQGDGIARVERGYVVIVPDTEPGERVEIEISNTRENVGFAEVIERQDYYE